MLKKSLKWISLITIAAVIIWLVFFLRSDNGKWLMGFGSWHTQSYSGGSIGAGELQKRLLQVSIAFIGGGALAFAGTLLQKVTKNRLAEVSILGIGSINILFIYLYAKMVGVEAFGSGTMGILMPVLLIACSIFGTILIWAISRSKKSNKNTFVIVGIAIQLLAEAISVVVVNPSKVAKGDEVVWNKIQAYTLGKVRNDIREVNGNSIPWWLIIAALVSIVLILFVAFMIRRKIDTYETSEEIAETSGINTKRLRLVIFILVALLAGIAAAVLGSIALLGIIAPSIARMIFKNRFFPLAIASFIIGGLLVTGASWLVMNLGWDLPVGILSTAIVIPYFLFLVIKEK